MPMMDKNKLLKLIDEYIEDDRAIRVFMDTYDDRETAIDYSGLKFAEIVGDVGLKLIIKIPYRNCE